MNITLLQSIRIGGVVQSSGTTLTVDDAIGADLVNRKAATNNSPFRGNRPVESTVDPLTGGIKISDVPAPSALLSAAVREIVAGNPADITLYGDSTADEQTEWFYDLGSRLVSGVGKNHGVAYRLWSDTNKQYSSISYISDGPLGRRHIVAGNASTSHRIEITSSAQVQSAGDFTVEFLVDLGGGAPSTLSALGGKNGAAGQRGWYVDFATSNKLVMAISIDGTNLVNRTSSVAIPAEYLNGLVWVRVTVDVDNGSSGNDTAFYVSLDRVTWVQVGTTITVAGVLAMFQSTQSLQFIGRGGASLANGGVALKFYEMRLYNSLDGTALAALIDAGSVPQRSALTSYSYVDDCGNAGSMYFAAGSTIVGSPRLCLFNGSVGGQVIAYPVDAANSNARWVKMAGGRMNVAIINYSHNEGAIVGYGTNYKTLTDLIIAKNPEAAIVGVLQNRRYSPAANIPEHEMRNQAIARYCAVNRWDTLDFFGLVEHAEMKSDGIHPDPATGVEQRMGALAYLTMQYAAGNFGLPT